MPASVITGILHDIAGNIPTARTLRFESISHPTFDTDGTVTARGFRLVDADDAGAFSISLWAGTYRVTVEDPSWQKTVFYIEIPTGGAAYDIEDVMVSGVSADTSIYKKTEVDANFFRQVYRFTDTSGAGIVQSTIAETSILPAGVGSLSLAANFFAVGTHLHLRLHAALGSGVAGGTLTLRFKVGANTFAFPVVTLPASLDGNQLFTLDALLGIKGSTAAPLWRLCGHLFVPQDNTGLNYKNQMASVSGGAIALNTAYALAWTAQFSNVNGSLNPLLIDISKQP